MCDADPWPSKELIHGLIGHVKKLPPHPSFCLCVTVCVRGFDGDPRTLKGALTFLVPIILDGLFNKVLPQVFAPNGIRLLQVHTQGDTEFRHTQGGHRFDAESHTDVIQRDTHPGWRVVMRSKAHVCMCVIVYSQDHTQSFTGVQKRKRRDRALQVQSHTIQGHEGAGDTREMLYD